MENRKRIIELLTSVRYTTNDIEKVADEICSLFNVVGKSEQLFKLRDNCVNGVDDEVCRNSGICKYCS